MPAYKLHFAPCLMVLSWSCTPNSINGCLSMFFDVMNERKRLPKRRLEMEVKDEDKRKIKLQ